MLTGFGLRSVHAFEADEVKRSDQQPPEPESEVWHGHVCSAGDCPDVKHLTGVCVRERWLFSASGGFLLLSRLLEREEEFGQQLLHVFVCEVSL